jgi:hypothetical protein
MPQQDKQARGVAMACRNVVGCLLLSLPFQSEAARQAPPAYTPSIAPILRDECETCHNHTLRQGGLNLESYESLMSGAKGGAVIVRGRSAESRLVQMIEGTRKPRMPIAHRARRRNQSSRIFARQTLARHNRSRPPNQILETVESGGGPEGSAPVGTSTRLDLRPEFQP